MVAGGSRILVAVQAGHSGVLPDAAFPGTLLVEATSGCLAGVTEDGSRFGVVFPAGSSLAADGAAVDVGSTGVTLRVGEPVVWGGTYVRAEGFSYQGPCAAAEYFLMNPVSPT